MKNEIRLRPAYWASVSGGKDSLYMLYLILNNLDKYPLDGVVHFELEIDYPFIKNVISYMESECKNHNIPFVRIKPRESWYDLQKLYGVPNRVKRWCNSKYKLDATYQLQKFLKSRGEYLVSYIGYCVDETYRYEKRVSKSVTEIYPLVEERIEEKTIWEWAKNEPIFNDYYKYNKRCGCMYCPLSSYTSLAYLLKYYPTNYDEFMEMCKATEKAVQEKTGKPHAIFQSNPKYNTEYVDNVVRTKYLRRLENDSTS